MRYLLVIIGVLLILPIHAYAGESDYSGKWEIDLRKGEDKNRKDVCGFAYFYLNQDGKYISGDHQFYPVGCGRINEGGKGTVRGVVFGDEAALVVKSIRNGAVALGVAKLENNKLVWELIDFIELGKPQGDALILGKGTLMRKDDK